MSHGKNLRPSIDDSQDDIGYGSGALDFHSSSSKEPQAVLVNVEETDERDKRRKWRRLIPKGEHLLMILTIIAVLTGILMGFLIRESDPSDTTKELIKFPGELLMRGLKMLIIPIIITSIVSGLANLDMKKGGRIGIHAIVYYFATTTLAVLLGIVLVMAIHPGQPSQRDETREEAVDEVSTLDTYLDLMRNILPENVISACFELDQTVLTKIEAEKNETTNFTNGDSEVKFKRTRVRVHNPNILGLIAFFVAFGIVLSALGEEAKPLTRIFVILNQIFMRMIMIVIWYSPIGITSMIASNVMELGDLEDIGKSLGMYMLTVITGLLIHGLIILPGIYFLFTRQNPLKLLRGVIQAVLTGLGTSSSAATLPITMRCLENNLGIDERVTRFVLPVGATMNMDGTALLEGVASITIAQMYGFPLSAGQVVTISVTATIASIGAAAIPSAGLVTLILVLTAIGIPTDTVALLWSIDWFLDRLRTAINIFGDCVGAAIVHHKNKDILEEISLSERGSTIQSNGICNNPEEALALMKTSV